MLHLPEINDVICRQLSPHELAQCARVCRRWSSIVIPYLWSNLSCLENSSDARRRAFSRLVLEDYLYEPQQHTTKDDHHGIEKSLETQPTFLSTLAKYSPWIRILPDPHWLLRHLRNTVRSTGRSKSPTQYQLLLHLYTRCPTVQVRFLSLKYTDLESEDKTTFIGFVLPRVRNLSIHVHCRDPRPEFSKMKDLLDRCSSTLENLYVDVSVHVNEDRKAAKEHVDAGSKGHNDWTSLRKLSLQVSNSNPDSMALCAWLWKRCSHVERLEIWEADGAVSSLVEGMMNSMDNLNEIILGERLGDTAKVTDFEVAALLSGSRKGWKVVRVGNAANFKEAAMGALVKHFPTLEEFISSGCNDIACENLVQVLSSCPNLHTLVDAYEDASLRDSRLHASTFIDLDYTTGTYRTWACESSLRAFKVKVAGIPRPGLRGAWVVKETYPGEGQLMQDLVYGRLARLTNLETLWLGMRPYEAYAFLKKPMKIQSDCVEMSLESGLHRLSGLKKLKELSVTGMTTRIGVKEVQWMTEHWPKLRVIYGLDDPDNEANNTEAATWLRQHHPEIELRNM